MGIELSVVSDMREVKRGLSDFRLRQVPFATAQALTKTARDIAAAETALVPETFDTPTPFTLRAFRVMPARKSTLTARVFAGDIQAAYLEPYLDGGVQALGKKRGILTPIKVALNAYGNIPRNKLASLKGKANVFVGPVKFKNGKTINGVWQRSARGLRRGGRRGTNGSLNVLAGSRSSLKLLIEFTDPKPVTKRFPYAQRAQAVFNKVWRPNFNAAFAATMATAR